ncbi:MAG: maleylpyruvate isomerase N-terminal domain-containing protein [Actinomycetota bacterium]|nr:maleylpyruvate isomerase N-terminal domain-containing protein [Actinomycetota bacterium]
MSDMPTPASLLGPEAAELLRRETRHLVRDLESLDEEQWSLKTVYGNTTILDVVSHLCKEADRVATAWDEHYEHMDEPLFRATDDPREHATVEEDVDPDEALATYQESMDRLQKTLQQARQDDWQWPVMTPSGEAETLAEAARRWLAHHYVHRQDIREIIGRIVDRHEDTVQLVVEFVLDAIARQGREIMPHPMRVEFTTGMPGAGTWTLVFDEPEEIRSEYVTVWEEILGWEPDKPSAHRVERGTTGAPRVRISGDGEQVWRAGFRRGARFDDLNVHGDDEALSAWSRLRQKLDEQGLEQRIGIPVDEDDV